MGEILREHATLRPALRVALRVDAQQFAAHRGEPHEFNTVFARWWNVLRLCWASDDFLGVALYRVRSSLRAAGVPILPAILNRICIALYSINIDDAIVIGEGLYLPHGNVVLGGITVIGRNAVVCPWASIGCRQGSFVGPTLGNGVFVGTHSSILGTMHVGDGVTIAAGSVVTTDISAGLIVAGVPARAVAEPLGAAAGVGAS